MACSSASRRRRWRRNSITRIASGPSSSTSSAWSPRETPRPISASSSSQARMSSPLQFARARRLSFVMRTPVGATTRMYPIWRRSYLSSRARLRPLVANQRVDDDRDQQNGARDHELVLRLEAQQVHSVRDRADDERTQQRAPHGTAAAEERCSGDDRSSDGEQQQVRAAGGLVDG